MRQDKAILIAYLTFIAFGIYEGILGVSWPAMSQTLGVPLESLGVLLLVGLVGFVLVSFNCGALIRAKSFHWVLLNSILLRALAFAAIYLFPSWPMVIIAVFAMSLGAGGIDSSLNTFVSSRGNALQTNWLHASFGVGATIGPFVAAGISILGGHWTWNFAIVSILLAIVAILVWRSAPIWDIKPAAQSAPAAAKPVARLTESLRLPIVWISILLFFFYTGSELAAGNWSFSLLTLGRGMPELDAKFWVGVYWGAFTIGRVLFGLVADRIPLTAALRFALWGTMAGAALLWWNPSEWAGLAGLVIMGIAEAPVYPSLIANTVMRVGQYHAPNAIGFQIAAGGVGGTALTALVGVIAAPNLELIAVSVLALCILTLVTYEVMLVVLRSSRSRNLLTTQGS